MWYLVCNIGETEKALHIQCMCTYNVCVRINGQCSDVNTKKPVVTYYTLGYVGREKYIGAKNKRGNLGRANGYLN